MSGRSRGPCSCAWAGRRLEGRAERALRGFPFLLAASQLVLTDLEVQLAAIHVEHDRVAVTDQRDRSTVRRLGSHVADAQSGGAAGKTPVGEQQDVLAQPGTLDRASDREHLAHSRAAPRTLVPDHHDVAGLQIRDGFPTRAVYSNIE